LPSRQPEDADSSCNNDRLQTYLLDFLPVLWRTVRRHSDRFEATFPGKEVPESNDLGKPQDIEQGKERRQMHRVFSEDIKKTHSVEDDIAGIMRREIYCSTPR
jgi:hypothetical protein